MFRYDRLDSTKIETYLVYLQSDDTFLGTASNWGDHGWVGYERNRPNAIAGMVTGPTLSEVAEHLYVLHNTSEPRPTNG